MNKRPTWWFSFLRITWPITTLSARMTRWPVIGRIVASLARPLVTGKNFHVTHIPVNLNVKGAGSTHIPERVLEELIRRSAHRITINRCHCRDSEHCKHYPIEDACLHLGEGTSHLDPHIATPRSVEGAIAHMRKMIGLGLIPMIGRVRLDDFFYGTPNTGRSLTICFCCPCCCTIFKSTRYFPDDVKDSLVRLKGLRASINNEGCTRCGICVDECFTRALSLGDNGVVWDESLCKGCGHCATVCPEKVIAITVDNVEEAIQDIMGRINERVNIGAEK
ncbi:MAG TPA: 4Fe-4S binding protein [Spirochaetota bacterium]|nr:4Fe-4S binding protein [Spirochaetota bacterium]HPC42438.1 4Fe-4S binding protein [Spirochaetota bacterium]HQF06575.1 4Fe-4S binding protein [Spirochaetota bacterium]HQH96022.1 4Fe-4S binding protein [Spirochaetota bacterium]HQJ70340.1 4Fe-4S binding protein [Spirochaetota bacterium]